jgi:tRNA pseudouridine55 synthase
VGHAGTLDPDATGVLVLGLGRATRLLKYLTGLSKRYVGEVVLGVETSTLDAAGEVVAVHDMSSVTLADVRAAAARFVGPIDQVPPMVSAVQIGGRRLHELARAGVEVDRPPRRVTVTRFDVSPVAGNGTGADGAGVFAIEVDCSSGTYVRTLAADLGTSLGGGAHLRRLRRTAVGSYTIDEAVALDGLGREHVLAPVEALRGYARAAVDEALAAQVAHGAVLDREVLVGRDEGDGPWAVVDGEGRLLAVYELRPDGRVKPSVVMAG